MPVIFFHAGFEFFSGGFIGVDVFFVISGYLITTILIEDIENNRFSVSNFYERRARRILPALFFVILLCILPALFWLTADEMKDFSQSLIAVSLFASNFHFWRETGYFDTAAEQQPLLHTWSLAVEEQYYVLFPILLYAAWRWKKKRAFQVVLAVAVLSFAFSEWGWRNNETANFYFPITRAWELLAGSLAAFIISEHGARKSELLSCVGLAAIATSISTFDETTPFPSAYALIPVIGTVLLILFAANGTLVARLLSNKLFVGIGLISYSAYLWHQPLFAFARIRSLEHPEPELMTGLAILSLMLAAVSWKYVERPFREKKLASSKATMFAVSGIASVGFIFLGLLGHFGILRSLPSTWYDSSYAGEHLPWKSLSQNKNASFVLVGDSHAKQYFRGLREHIGPGSMLTESACLSLPYLTNVYRDQAEERISCINLYQRVLAYISENQKIDTVFLASRYKKKLYDLELRREIGILKPENHHALQTFERRLRELISMFPKNVRLILIGNVPSAAVAQREMKNGMIKCLVVSSNCPTEYDRSMREGRHINDLLRRASDEHTNVEFFDPADALCDSSKCYLVKNGQLIYSDHAHLTNFGANAVVRKLLKR